MVRDTKILPRPFIPVPNTALVEMVYVIAGQYCENTFHVQKGSPWTAAQLQALVTAFDAWDGDAAYANRWALRRGNGSVLVQYKTKDLTTSSGDVYIYTVPGGGRAGGIASQGTALPPNVTKCFTLQTGRAGRSQRGRLYFPGMYTVMIQAPPSQGFVAASWANNCVTTLNELITRLTSLGYTWVVTSYMTGGIWRSSGQNTPIINVAYHTLAVDNQRRRLPGRGL